MNTRRESDKRVNFIVSFLWWCSGAVHGLLREVPTEWNKYAFIGAGVLTTALLSIFTGGYAVYLVLGSPWPASIVGILWGLMIFNLDRFIVATLVKDEGIEPKSAAFTAQLLKAMPRLIMAVLIGVVIARPLVMAVLRKPIELQIYQSQNAPIEEIKQKIAMKEAEISSLNERVAFESNKINKLIDAYIEEARGVRGSNRTGVAGAGPAATERLAAYKQAEQDFLAKKAELDEQLGQKKVELAALSNQEGNLNEVRQTSQSNLAVRINALSDLVKKDYRVAQLNYFIILLIILLEINPVLIKLLSPAGPYEEMVRSLARESRGVTPLATDEISAQLQKAINRSLDNSSLNPRKEKLKP